MKLYELATNYVKVQELIEEGATEAMFETLAALEDAIEDKAENIGKMIQSFNAECEAIKNEEKRLVDRRKSLENKTDGLKRYLQEQLELAGLQKVKRATITVAIQNNPPSVNVENDGLIPQEYWVIPEPVRSLDKKTLLKVMKEGVEVPGASIKQGKSLRIK